jgi:hypothetical protein
MKGYITKFGFEYNGTYYNLFDGEFRASVEDFVIENEKDYKTTSARGYAFVYNQGTFSGKEFVINVNKVNVNGIIEKMKIYGNVDDVVKFFIQVNGTDDNNGEEFYFYATYLGLTKNIHMNANTLNTTTLKFFRHSRYLKNSKMVFDVDTIGTTEKYPYTYQFTYGGTGNSVSSSAFTIKKTSLHEAFVELQVFGGYNGFKVGVGGELSDTQRNGWESTVDLTNKPNDYIVMNTFPKDKNITLYEVGGNIIDVSKQTNYGRSTYFTLKNTTEVLYFNNVQTAVLTLIEQFDEV